MTGRVELVFGLVGPIGCPIHEAGHALEACLKSIDYKTHSISLSGEMDSLLDAKNHPIPSDGLSVLENKIKKGNAVRTAFGNNSVLAAEAIRQIVEFRRQSAERQGADTEASNEAATVPLDEHAFIVDQLKRPEEIDLLVKAFGKRFIQVSVVTSLEKRKQSLISRLGSEQHGWDAQKCKNHADHLIETDQNEKLDVRGQQISKIFHLGDVFLSGETDRDLEKTCRRFVEALFGKTNIAPTRDEFGSYMAKAASLRSVDLSRQVGAAICTKEGDIISMGCNEVPKFGGGNFWDEDDGKRRDIDLGGEANKNEINRIIFNFVEVLQSRGVIDEKTTVESILSDEETRKAIKKSLIGGITEYGRMVHAEMNALSDASRLGRSVKGATLHVTTYPCHNCAKHIVAAGIDRIVFVEPYPKSKVESLFNNIISPDSIDNRSVSIEHFFGISARRYRDIFEKGSRQNDDGEVEKWYKGLIEPRLGNVAIGSTTYELQAIFENLYSEV